MPEYFDIHSHLNFPDYDVDREAVIARLKETGTLTITVGTNLESSKRAVALADKHENIYACIGIHPVDNSGENSDISLFSELAKNPKVVMIGECGMDFYHARKEDDYNRQKKLFIEQIEFALAHDKPIMIHARDAYQEILEVLESYKEARLPLGSRASKLRGNVHFFAGSWEIAQRFFAIDFTVSFTGVITFVTDYDKVIKNAPLDKILSETDAPYVAPVPYRGKRNEPNYVKEVVKRIAEVRGEDEEKVKVALVGNGLSMIG